MAMNNDATMDAAATADPHSRRRKTLLVKRGFQIKYSLISIGLFAMAAFLVYWEFYYGFQAGVRQGLIQNPAAVAMFDRLSFFLLIKVFIALGLVWSLSIVLSHYLAGPIYRLEESLKLLKAGDLGHRVYLREKDELKSLAAAYNEAMESLQDRVESDREVIRDVVARLETLTLTEGSADTAAKIQAVANKLKDISSGFSS